MFFKILINYIFGYVRIKVEGYFTERFINICASKNILIWNIKRKNSSIFLANIGKKDFKKLKQISKKTKCKINIQNKKGLPFILHKYKKRKIFAGFLIIIFILTYFSSMFLWNIQIEGTTNISKEEIEKNLKEVGLKIGMQKNKINSKNIINEIRLKRDDIAWIGIDLKGTNAIIKIVEADQKPEIIKEDEYCNIVATKPGVITKINAQNGIKQVEVGDVVKKGTLLIAGWMEGKYTGTRYVHAKGEIEAKVWYTHTSKIYFKQQIKEETTNEENKYSIKLNNFEINLYKTLSNFKNYDTIYTNKKLKLFSNFYLPIEIIKKTNKEIKNVEKTYTLEEAKNIGIEEANEKLKQIDEQKIVNKQINFYENKDYVEVEVIYEVLEEIGTNEKIVF